MALKWSQVGGIVGKLAPTIGAALGGPLAGSAISVVENALGVNKGAAGTIAARCDGLGTALQNAAPDQLLAVKNAENDFALKMQALGFQDSEAVAALAVGDLANARGREIATHDWTPKVLAFAVTVGFFGLLIFMALRAVPNESKDVLNILLGSLGAGWMAVMSYYFGSSSENAAAKVEAAKK